jgi:hypothetical protein
MIRDQAHMGEADLGFVTFFGDFKSDLCAVPLALVFDKTKVAVQDKPNDFFAGNEFRYLLFGTMDVFVTIGKLVTEFVGATFNFP